MSIIMFINCILNTHKTKNTIMKYITVLPNTSIKVMYYTPKMDIVKFAYVPTSKRLIIYTELFANGVYLFE